MAIPFRTKTALQISGQAVGNGAVGLDNLPIVDFDIRLTTASGKDVSVMAAAMEQLIPTTLIEAGRAFADKLVAQAKQDYAGTGLGRSAKLRPGAVHMQDHLFPLYPEQGDPTYQFGMYTTPPAWHTEYHEHGTFAQRRLPSGFARQYRARSLSLGKAKEFANAKVPGLFEPGRRPAMRGRIGVRPTHWLTNSAANSINPYLRAVEVGMANYWRQMDGGATTADAERAGLRSTFRALGKSGLANVVSSQRNTITNVVTP